jgi:hypothetical protein
MRATDFIFEDNPDYDEDRFLKSDPGTPLSFPKGTTLVNVSDVYDWYKLGMAVSDLDDADPRTFNKGVPHTVFAFGSEEEEHKMIPLLKRLGFSLHDIDSPEDYQKAIRADEAIAHLEEMVERRVINDDSDLPDMGKDTWSGGGSEFQPDWTQQIGIDAGQGYQRASGNLPGDINLSIAADSVGPTSQFMPQKGMNISKGPASLYLGDRGAVSGSYNIPIDKDSSVSLSASGQKNLGLTGVGAQYQRGNFSAGVNQPNFPGAKPQFNVGYSAQFEDADLDEMAGKVHGGVRKELAKQGYKYLGSGIDKQAYLEPGTGQILVIFGYGRWSKGKFSPDQLTFVNWAKYCQQNSNNPHLPRFSGWESFDFNGQRYLQIRMEPLRELPQNLKDIVSWLEDYIDERGKIDSKKVAKRIGAQGVEEFDYDEGDFYQKKVKAKKIIEYLGGAQAAAGLMKTVQIAKRMANKEGVNLDLHGGNYMQRGDGTIVVNDPFVTTFF